jgi:hypothetical protein
MRNILMATMLVASLSAMPMVVGCDRTVSEHKSTTTTPGGAQTTSEQKTVQHPDGSVTTEKNVSHNPPANNP